MSRSFYSFNPKPDTGHKIIEYRLEGSVIYCPIAKASADVETRTKELIAPHTSGNIKCPHCGKVV